MQLKSIKIITALTFLAGVALFLISNLLNYSDQEIVETVEANLGIESESLATHIKQVKANIIRGNLDFNQTKYPTFLFKNSTQISWNHYEFDVKELLNHPNDQIEIANIRNSTLVFIKSNIRLDSTDFLLLSFFPIQTNYPFNNQYLVKRENPDIFPKGVTISGKTPDALRISYGAKVVFYVVASNEKVYSRIVQHTIQILTILFTVGLFLGIFLGSQRLAKNGRQKTGLFILLILIILARTLMVLYNYPNAYLNMDLFRSRVFMSSAANSSIGDLFLNNLSLLIITIFLVTNQDWVIIVFKNLRSKILKNILLVVQVVFSFCLLAAFFDQVYDLITSAQIPLDIYSGIEISILSISGYLAILLSGISYFFINDLIYKIVLIEVTKYKKWILVLSISMVLVLGVLLMIDRHFFIIVILQSLYVLIVHFYELPIRLNKLKFGTFLYGLAAIFLLALTSSIAVYKGFEFNELVKKEKLTTRLLIDRDIEGEYLLHEIIEDIKSDVFINSLFVNPQSPKKQIHERINRYFNSGYFDNYNVKVVLFDRNGNSLDETITTTTFSETKNKFTRRNFKSDFGDIFYQKEEISSGRIRYVCFLDLERYKNHTGSVLLDLRLKKQVSKSVYPELLLEHRFTGRKEFDYAIFNDKEIIYKFGEFNYNVEFDRELFSKDRLYKEGIEVAGIHHLGIKGKNKTIIISSPVYVNWAMLSNFSFYFLLMLSGGIAISLINSLLSRNSKASLSFSTKILIYIGCAFAVPIALVGFAIISTINRSYKDEIEKSYEKKTLAISENIVGLIDKYMTNEENREGVTNEISKIGRTARADINIYGTDGKLITTSQPKVFESGLLTSFINPVALEFIGKGKGDNIIIDESIGRLSYKSSYVAIRAFEDGKLLGIMSSPFFGSKNHLKRQQSEIFNNIINITTLIFIFSVWFTYIAVRRLTNPIILIASKLKKTELEEDNQPLEWGNNDEIGVLIQEYNKMVVKLEISKKELAKNEKEAAWREMAKQVAHEIKNPLTPMKLTLQHLDRVMSKDDDRRKSLNTLLSQVDTLDEIVTSFSHFAKMPDPENVDFNIKGELEKIIHLHADKNISLNDSASGYYVHADKKLFGRIFNNIVLNAFEAMSKENEPELIIELSSDDKDVLISFSDFGSGISEEIREKVFIPNFSTKDSGSGIGLAVAKRGIEHAGGTIHFESESGKGTTFFIRLPIVHNPS